MQLYYIRHGQSENNRLWVETGREVNRSEDPILSPLGVEQAELLAGYLSSGTATQKSYLLHDPANARGFQLTHLYSSLMWRALATANQVAERLDLPIYGLADIYEGGGIYLEDPSTGELVGQPGKTPRQLREAFPRLILPEGLN